MDKEKIYEIINKFIDEMGYKDNEHVLGIYFYGSYQLGCANEDSDIDLHVIFDDLNPKHIVRGNHFIDGMRIEYFEKPKKEMYLTINEDYQEQNNALLLIVGKSEIIMDKTGDLEELQEYATEKFINGLPCMDENDAKEYVSILNNRMIKVKNAMLNSEPYFYHLYHLTVEKIRKFYHNLIGSSKIQTSKVIRIYTDEEYSNLINKGIMPDEKFRKMYIDLIADQSLDMYLKYTKLKEFYDYARSTVDLDENSNYRINIRSRSNIKRR